jgi:phosphate transport system substrate-binding protein
MSFARVALILCTGSALLGPTAGGAVELLRATGTGTALGTMRLLSAAFEKANPGHGLQVLASVGSGGAFKAVAGGAVEIGLSARPLRSDEYQLGLVALPYARTPFFLAAGPRTGVTGITATELARIYRGELATWPGGERVRVVLRPKADADTQILQAVSDELKRAIDAAHAREGMLLATTNQECRTMLERTPGTIGPASLTQALTEGMTATPLLWNGVAPTLKNLEAGAYPLEKRLYLVIRAPATPDVRRFVAFLASPEARRILEQTGNLPLPLPRLE